MAAFEELDNATLKNDGIEAPTKAGAEEDDQNFDEWIVEELEHLSLDPEVYQTYVKGIMDDADTSLEERAQSVLDMLSGATEEDLSGFGSNLVTMWELEELKAQNRASEAAATPSADAAEYLKRLEEDKQAAQAALDRQAEEMANRHVDRHEARGREALLSRYAAVGDGLDEEGNVIASAEVARADVGLSHMLGANTNKARVQEEARAMRDKAKADHALKVARDKEQQLRETMRKEKEKRRTQKREKQRGCG